ncbi:NAD(P)/FAD-dependent oxidoreductase [Gandjariella thermophila]|uniref:Ferredoxin reductase n=1 Tax=Gandjariella thermophila TaxID=1931992 RepID=A0A4D4J9I2_9PSEU|nr:FAD-dependent oxidoreductase [Gandjariella thermophila]GDY31660.1 ferredoxin reductase [Gandjariella thermophila]
MTGPDRIVVVGAGLAGLSAAERLREHGWDGELVIVGDEPHRPYNRTPLSKELLTGDRQPAELRLRCHTELDAVWRTGTEVRGVDLRRRVLALPHGERLDFDGLVIATGAEARHLPGAPTASPRVHLLRTVDDARALDVSLATARRLVVVGGGFIGCELASTARERALDVSIVASAPTLLARPLGDELGEYATELHRRHGVRLYLDNAVAEWSESRRGITLRLRGGERLRADTVVIGIGAVPRADWLAGNGLDLSDGVACTPTCHVLGPHRRPLDGIVAAGDVARWPNLRIDPVPRRVEHWLNAIEMGQHAATALLTGPRGVDPFTPVPRFWSHQHGVRIQSVGMPGLGGDLRVLDGSMRSGRFVAGFLRPHYRTGQEVLLGAVAFDAPRALLRYRDHINRPLPGDLAVEEPAAVSA